MKIAVLLCFAFFTCLTSAQNSANDTLKTDTVKNIRFNYKQLIIPSVLIGYGIVGLESDQLKTWNLQLRDEVKEDIDEKISIDDFTQWAPAAAVFALDGLGIESKNSLRDRSVILLTSYVIMSSTVFGLKTLTHVERPDGTTMNSFPSGHTATAFAGAEFLWQEYKDKSIWIGIGGYAVAAATGVFRVYNNRHWVTDVVAGAGIGILSTKIAYWLNPYISNALFGGKQQEKASTSFIMPGYDGRYVSLSFVKTF
ncbi:MAG: phosphatase PAP2 family protein [Bacteroidota bacterium]